MEIRKIAVVGAGAMGSGIAQAGIMAGYKVALQDIRQQSLDSGVNSIRESLAKFLAKGKITENQRQEMLKQLFVTIDLKSAVKDSGLVIEAVFEDLDLKKKIFKELDSLAPADAILASNTSSMSITAIAGEVRNAGRVVGMHFFNPVVLYKALEIIYAAQSSDAAVEAACLVAKKMGKTPVIVKKDSPGFIYNRVNAPIALLLQLILDRGKPTPAQFDAAFKGLMPMAPFELTDYIGLDLMMNTQNYFGLTLSKDYLPRKALVDLVKTGRLGMKSGKGIYDWSNGRPQINTSNPTTEYDFTHLIALQVNEATKLLEEGVSDNPEQIDLIVAGGTGLGPFAMAAGIGYSTLVRNCNELADKFGIETFRATKTMKASK